MREKVANATLAVIAREGFDAATIRNIASELACTTSVVTHYFVDKDDLLAFAFRSVSRQITEQIALHANHPDPLTKLRFIAAAFMSSTRAQKARWRVWLAFVAAALPKRAQLARQERHYAALQTLVVALLREMDRDGLLRRDLDLHLEAERFIAMIDGVGLHGVLRPRVVTAALQSRMLEQHLRSLLKEPG